MKKPWWNIPSRACRTGMRPDRLGAFDLACFHALGANICTLYATINLDGDLLNVGAEGAIGNPMRVAYVVTSAWGFPADFAYLRHVKSTPFTSYDNATRMSLICKAVKLYHIDY